MLKQSRTRWSIPPPIAMRRSLLLTQIARSFLAGEPSAAQIVMRFARTLGKSRRWVSRVAKRYVEHFAGKTRPRLREVVEFLRNDREFRKHWHRHSRGWSIAEWITEPEKMRPVAAAKAWGVPVIESVGLSQNGSVSALEIWNGSPILVVCRIAAAYSLVIIITAC